MSCKCLLIHHGEDDDIITGPFKFEDRRLCKIRRPTACCSTGLGVSLHGNVQVNKFKHVQGIPVWCGWSLYG